MPDELDDLLASAPSAPRGTLTRRGDDPNLQALADPRVKGFLDKISKSEGADYNTLVGGRKISDLSRHPNIVGLRTSAGPSTAFGRYQITGTTNKSKLRKYADLDYSPENQDIRAVELLRQTGALDALQQGDEQTAIKRAGKEWASIPGSPLPGRKSGVFSTRGFSTAYAKPEPDSLDALLADVPDIQTDPQVAELAQVGEQAKAVVEPPVVAAPIVRRRVQPQITSALDQLTRNVNNLMAGIKPQPLRPAGMGDVQQASRMRDPSIADIRMADNEPIGFNRRGGQPSRVTQTPDELRVMKGEQPIDRQAYARQQDAQARLSQMRDLGNDFDPVKQEQWHAANEPAIQKEIERYRQDIRSTRWSLPLSRAGPLPTLPLWNPLL